MLSLGCSPIHPPDTVLTSPTAAPQCEPPFPEAHDSGLAVRAKARKRMPSTRIDNVESCAHDASSSPRAAVRMAAPIRETEEPDASDAAWSAVSQDLQLRLDRRDMIEQVLGLADHLAPCDRALIRGVFGSGMSPADMADAMQQHTRQVRARIRQLLRHVAKPAFKFISREHERWPAFRRSVARAVVLQRASQREAARDIGISLHRVRRELERIRGIVDTALGPGALVLRAGANDEAVGAEGSRHDAHQH